MSRSYKKTPIWKGCGMGKAGKVIANRKVRRTKDVPNGNAYRKVFQTWDIYDWVMYEPYSKFKKEQEIRRKRREQGIDTWFSDYYEDEQNWKKTFWRK